MGDFVQVAKVDEVPPGTATTIMVDGVDIALVNLGGEFYALSNECPHAGGPIGDGDVIDDRSIECPLHGSVFDVATGEVVQGPADEPLQTYQTKVENGVVMVSID